MRSSNRNDNSDDVDIRRDSQMNDDSDMNSKSFDENSNHDQRPSPRPVRKRKPNARLNNGDWDLDAESD